MRKDNFCKESKTNSLILAGQIKNEKKMRGMEMRIIICFGDWTRSGTFFTEKYYTTRTVPRLVHSTKLSPVRRG